MRERMLSIISKLELGEEEKQRVHSELAGHSPSMLKEIRRRLDEMEVLKLEKIGQVKQQDVLKPFILPKGSKSEQYPYRR